MIDVCTTLMLLLLMVTHHVPSVAMCVLWIHQISEKLRLPGMWFHCRVQLLTAGYMTCSVNWHFSNKTVLPVQAFELLVHKYKFEKKYFNFCLSYDAPGLQNGLPLDIYRAFQE